MGISSSKNKYKVKPTKSVTFKESNQQYTRRQSEMKQGELMKRLPSIEEEKEEKPVNTDWSYTGICSKNKILDL